MSSLFVHMEDEDKRNVEECFLSDHTIAMRQAHELCTRQLEFMSLPTTAAILWDTKSFQHTVEKITSQSASSAIDVLQRMPNPSQFRDTYVRMNRPCLIQDPIWAEQYFGRVIQCWGSSSEDRRQWFADRWSQKDFLPVKRSSTYDEVDDHGRAAESETEHLTLTEWYDKLDTSSADFYLKDWHFQKYYETHFPSEEALYQTPPQFENDLLNQMQLLCTKGDYRFTYWGPDGSQTGRHTDVLNSFSWSFNVVGVKEWTFYTPAPIKLLQHAGECVFVPAMMPHTVKNIGETLSVNHNWITSSNLASVWQCIQDEIESVETELKEWKKSTPDLNYDWDAKESMLRGCVGLDVTAFFLMILLGIAKTLPQSLSHEYDISERDFDLIRLGDILVRLMTDQDLYLKDRLEASLADHKVATLAYELAQRALNLIAIDDCMHRK